MTLTEFLLARIAEDEAGARPHVDSPGPERRWVSNRVLAECEAKRAIAALHRNRYGLGDCESCADGWEDMTTGDGGHSPLLYPCPTLRILAGVYADHPDYREEWAL